MEILDQFFKIAEAWGFTQEFLGQIAVFSIVAFVGTLIAIPAILVRLPEDYFLNHMQQPWFAGRHPLVRAVGLTIKNALGIIFFIAGIAMLFLPGQGLLTMLAGFLLLDLPAKKSFQEKLIQNPKVQNALNAFREKAGKAPFRFKQDPK